MLNDNNMGAKLLGLSIFLTFTGFVLCIPSLFWASSDLPCKILANFCGSQYLIPSLWCTFQNINWVLLFKTGKIFPKLVHNLAGWFFCFKPSNFRCIPCVLPEYPIPPIPESYMWIKMAMVTSIGGIVTAHLLTLCCFIQGLPLVQLFERQGETVLVRYQPLLNVLFSRFL